MDLVWLPEYRNLAKACVLLFCVLDAAEVTSTWLRDGLLVRLMRDIGLTFGGAIPCQNIHAKDSSSRRRRECAAVTAFEVLEPLETDDVYQNALAECRSDTFFLHRVARE